MLKFIPLLVLLTACNFTVSMMHSEGSTDTQTESQAASPTVSPTISVPLPKIAKNEPTSYQPREPDGKNGSDRQYEYQDWS